MPQTPTEQFAAEVALPAVGQPNEVLTADAIADVLERKFLAERGVLEQAMEAQFGERLAEQQKRIAELEAEVAAKPPAKAKRKPRALTDGIDGNAYNPAAIGAQFDGDWDSLGEFFLATIAMSQGRKDPRLHTVPEGPGATLSIDSISGGGALVPEEFRSQLLSLMLQPNTWRSGATVIPMGATTVTIPAIRDVSHAGDTLYGGVRMYWTAPGGTITRTDPSFKQIRLTAKSLKGFTAVDAELTMDSAMSLGPMIAMMFAGAAAWEEERVFLNGDGAGEPLGVLESPVLVNQADVATTGDDKIGATDIAAMESHLLPESSMRAVYYIHPSSRDSFITMTNDSVQFMQESLTSRPPMTLLGRPIYVSEHLGIKGAANQCLLADRQMYVIGDRQAMSFRVSDDFLFDTDQIGLRGVCRLDGQPWMDTSFRPKGGAANGNDNLSPFVALGAT